MDFSGRERNRLFVQEHESFREAGFLAGADLVSDGRQVAAADLDRDGATDLIVASRNTPRLTILRGTPAGSWIAVRVDGDAQHLPLTAVGATVRATRCGVTSRHLVSLTDGFGAQSSRDLTIGVGDCNEVDSLEVRWPDGSKRRFARLAAGRRYRLRPTGEAEELESAATSPGGGPLGWLITALSTVGDANAPWTYVALTASWCDACKRAVPAQEALAEALGDRVRSVYVSVEESDDAATLATTHPSRLVPRLALPAAKQKELAVRLRDVLGGTPPLPSGVLIDDRGHIRWRGAGVPDAATLLAIATPGDPQERRAGGAHDVNDQPPTGFDWWWLVIATVVGALFSAVALRGRRPAGG